MEVAMAREAARASPAIELATWPGCAHAMFVAGLRNPSVTESWHKRIRETQAFHCSQWGIPMTPNEAASRRASIIAVFAVTCAICALYLPLFLG
jgi:hypothetical protein